MENIRNISQMDEKERKEFLIQKSDEIIIELNMKKKEFYCIMNGQQK